MADDSIIKYSDLIGDDGTFDDILKNIKKIEKELIASAKRLKKEFSITNPNDVQRIQQLEKEVRELTQANKNLAKANKVVNDAKKKSQKLTMEELIALEKKKIALQEERRLAKAIATIEREKGNTIKSLRAQLTKATIEWSKFTAAEMKNNVEAKKALKTKKDLTAQLKKLEKATGDNRRNVGNYTSALSGLDAAFVGLGSNISVSVGAFKSLGLAIGGTARKFGVLKTAIAASGIGALVLALGSIVTMLKRTTSGADKLSQIFAGVGATVNVLLDRIAALGTAIVQVFSGDFAGAAETAKKAITGVFAEIKKESSDASKDAKELNAQYEKETKLIVENGQKRLKIAKLEREAEENKKKNRALAAQQLKEAIKLTNEIFNSELEIDKKRLEIAKAEEARGNSLKEDRREIATATDAINNKEAQRENIIRGLTRKLNSLTQSEDANQKALEKRIKAIEKLNQELRRLQTENIEDANQRSIELEKLRFKEEQALRESQFKELEEFFEGNEERLREIEKLSDDLKEEQEKQHQQNLIDIADEYAQKKVDAATNTVKTAQDLIKKQNEENEQLVKDSIKGLDDINETEEKLAQKRSERLKKNKEEQEQLIQQISDTANKIGQEIVNLLEKQADVAEENVNAQVENLDRARERAANGLESNLAFEEKELAERQREQKQKEKEAQQAAKLLTLFNLVSAYAANGDENALARGLVDFALLEAASAAIQGTYFEGTEDTGTTLKPLDNKGGRLAILHDNERVMTKAQNMLLSGMSNEQVVQNALIGEQVGDYFNPQGITHRNHFEKQKEDFIKSMQGSASMDNSSVLINEVKQLRKEMSKQPNFSVELQKIYNDMYGLVQAEVRRGMKVVTKQKLRKRF